MATQAERQSYRITLGKVFQRFGLPIMIVLMMAVFATLNENFLTFSNMQNVLEQNAALAIVAVGITFGIISTLIDLSPGSVIALTGVITAIVFRDSGNIALAIVVGVLSSILIGVFNGALIAKLNLNPVIVTLAAFIWARGLALALTQKDSIIIQSSLVGFMNNRYSGVISPTMVFVVLAYILGFFMLNKTRLGRYSYALGGDEVATKQAGVPTDWYKIGIFVFSGFLVGFAALITVSRMGAAQPNAVFGLELDAIAAVIIGGVSLSGGEGRLRQTIVGVVFLSLLNNGLSTLGLRDATVLFYKGLVILMALFLEVTSRQMLKDEIREVSVKY